MLKCVYCGRVGELETFMTSPDKYGIVRDCPKHPNYGGKHSLKGIRK